MGDTCFLLEDYNEICVLRPPRGPQKVVLYDRWSFIEGTNIWKCMLMFLLKLSYMTGGHSSQWS